MKRRIAALTAALVAFPAVAFADPPESVTGHWAPPPLVVSDSADVPSHLPARGTDVAAPDQQASKPAPSLTVSAKGTDVAAADQQASKPAPVALTVSTGDDFDWADAGVGALAGTALAAFAIAGAVGVRRRPPTPLAG
ncbi:MAG: hypothetical protein ACAH82_16970 [Solirubrobacteraceae bacterium]